MKKKMKCSNTKKMKMDRLSSLPDSVLVGHVLSCLDMKEVVMNSLISKRWRYLWTSVPCLNFSESYWNVDENGQIKDVFMNFVDRVLLLRDTTSITKLVLRFSSESCDENRPKAWLTVAARRNVEELHFHYRIYAHGRYGVQIPHCISEAPRLKTLYLHHAKFANAKRTFVLSCSILENFTMVACNHQNLHLLKIDAPQLRHLLIDNEFCDNYSSCELQVRSSKLVSVELSGPPYKKYSLPKLFSLVAAKLSLCAHPSAYPLTKLLEKFCCAKSVELEGNPLKPEEMPDNMFYSLRKLKCLRLMRGLRISRLGAMLNLLRSSPCIQTLVIELIKVDEVEDDGQELIPCKFHHLKSIELRGIPGSEIDLKLVEFLLKNATVLEKLKINITGSRDKAEVVENIGEIVYSLPRASPNITIIIM